MTEKNKQATQNDVKNQLITILNNNHDAAESGQNVPDISNDIKKTVLNVAKNNLSNAGNKKVSKQELKSEMDNVYSDFDISEDSIKDDNRNGFYDTVNFLRELLDSLPSQTIGNALDFTVGNLERAFTGGNNYIATRENLDAAGDLIFDLALSSLGPLGIAATVGKNAIQNSDSLYEGLYGVDPLTGTTVDDAKQRAFDFGGALLATGLSAIPGMGAARATSKAAKAGFDSSKENVAEAIMRMSAGEGDDAAKAVTSAATSGSKNTATNATTNNITDMSRPEMRAKIKEARQSAMDEYEAGVKENLNNLTLKQQNDYIKGKIKAGNDARDAMQKELSYNGPIQQIKNAIQDIPAKDRRSVGQVIKDVKDSGLQRVSNAIDNVKTKDIKEIAKDYASDKGKAFVNKARTISPLKDQRVAGRRFLEARNEDKSKVLADAMFNEAASKIGKQQGFKDSLFRVANNLGGRVAPGIGLALYGGLSEEDINFAPALASLLFKGKKMNIGPSGKRNFSFIPNTAFGISEGIKSSDNQVDVSKYIPNDQIISILRSRG